MHRLKWHRQIALVDSEKPLREVDHSSPSEPLGFRSFYLKHWSVVPPSLPILKFILFSHPKFKKIRDLTRDTSLALTTKSQEWSFSYWELIREDLAQYIVIRVGRGIQMDENSRKPWTRSKKEALAYNASDFLLQKNPYSKNSM